MKRDKEKIIDLPSYTVEERVKQHQKNIPKSLQRKYRVVKEVGTGEVERYSTEQTQRAYGVRALIGIVLWRASVFQGPFLPADVVRRYRFEGTTVTDSPDEMRARYSREKEQELRKKLNRLLGMKR